MSISTILIWKKNYPTLDSAIIGAVEVEYEHGRGMAAYYYEKILNLSKEPEVVYSPKQNFGLLTSIDEYRIEGIKDAYPWGPVLDVECIDRFQIVNALHDGGHRISWHIYDDYRDECISLPTLAYALAVCMDMKHGSHDGKNAWAYAKMLNLFERPDKE